MLSFLDPSSTSTGWCAGNGDTIPECGAWQFPDVGNDYGRLIDVMDRFLSIHVERFRPDEIGYEAPILVVNNQGRAAGRYTDKLSKLRKLYPLGAHIEFFCLRRGIPCFELNPKDIKKGVTGNPNAQKESIRDIAVKCGVALPKHGEMDASDAWGGWVEMVRQCAPQYRERWDRAIWSPRGGIL